VPLAWALLLLIATAVTASTGAAACGTKAFEAATPLTRNPDDPFRLLMTASVHTSFSPVVLSSQWGMGTGYDRYYMDFYFKIQTTSMVRM